MRKTPAHIIEAAQRLAAQAPAFDAEQLAQAYRAIGVMPDAQTVVEPPTQAAA